jgi:hypothetical protein
VDLIPGAAIAEVARAKTAIGAPRTAARPAKAAASASTETAASKSSATAEAASATRAGRIRVSEPAGCYAKTASGLARRDI